MLNQQTVLVTGGTGSIGNEFAKHVLEHCRPKKLIIYSRDEFKQYNMREKFKDCGSVLRFIIGDVRDKDRLFRAFEGVDYVVHAAAMKQVTTCEYNPNEAVKTNIHGAMNVTECALDRGVKRVVALSTDKAVNPINLYGGTKLVSDKLFISANGISHEKGTLFSVVRYGNVAGSRGSVIPLFRRLIEEGKTILPITNRDMTRFWISSEKGVKLIITALSTSRGGEIYVAKIPSFRVTDLAEAMLPGCGINEVGIREGEKLHEAMIARDDAENTREYDGHYVIYPHMDWWNYNDILPGGRPVEEGFEYNSGTNKSWLSIDELRALLATVRES